MAQDSNEILQELRQANPDRNIQTLVSPEFARYGVVYTGYDLTEVNAYMDDVITIPTEKNIYNTTNEKLEALSEIQKIGTDIYAGMQIQAGECAGQSTSLTAVEYHQGSELNIFQTDVVMILGKRSDFITGEFAADKKAKLFFVPRGSVVEFFSDTLHYSPCKVHPAGFKFIVMVLKGTNEVLSSNFKSNNPMIIKQNKFQVVHAVRQDKIDQGVKVGVTGKLVTITPLTD
ncbi:DUF4867 family protein [Loigolactobacillus coryniformis]|uniref:DUF4867 family protein n=1 Tax=Loigolactobacillus coryniformis TaxID=1610 RepID=UPI001C5EAF3F|nr:DUF4867 family protein [Loigolactobacillus coryniformis]MBW4803705.1 DUF4867 family protein [Loigolactobacillus coryniformis subsp. torquens]MBW4806407.1 DUF4867 family protein [Loigolactobacillus coryniformis subsp. torquens]